MSAEAGPSRSSDSSVTSLPPSAFSHSYSDRTSASSQPSGGTRQSSVRDSDKTGASTRSFALMTPPENGTYIQPADAATPWTDGMSIDGPGGSAAFGAGPGSAGGSRPGSRMARFTSGISRASPPPPAGPPPSDPPPLPPASSHPFAHPFAQARKGFGSLSRRPPPPVGPLPSLPPDATLSNRSASATLPRPGPPPTDSLPPLPSQVASARSFSASASTFAGADAQHVQYAPSRTRNADPGPSRDHSHTHSRPGSISSLQSGIGIPTRSSSLTPPTSPIRAEAGGPSISPRNSSLYIKPQNGSALDPPFQLQPTSRPTSSHARAPSQSYGHRAPSSAGGSAGSGSGQTRTPSKQLLQSALELAQQAVEMDRQNNVPSALEAYKEAVRRLKDVIERVSGVGGSDKRRSGGRSEDEGRTLRGIHDAYVARIELLSSYEAPEEPEPHSPPGIAIQNGDPMKSTATLVPTARQTDSPENGMTDLSHGERTPRPSVVLDPADTSGIADIGNLMLSDGSGAGYSHLGAGRGGMEDSPTTPMPGPAQVRAAAAAAAAEGTAREAGHARTASQTLQEVIESGPSRASPAMNGSARAEQEEWASPSKDKALPIVPSLESNGIDHLREISDGGSFYSPDSQGPTINQRRHVRSSSGSMSAIPELSILTPASPTEPTQPFPRGPDLGPSQHPAPLSARSVSAVVAPATSGTEAPRIRAQSQPGHGTAHALRNPLDSAPVPVPLIPSQHLSARPSYLAPPPSSAHSSQFAPSSPRSLSASAHAVPASSSFAASGMLLSPIPEPQPSPLARRPFHLLRLLLQSMDPSSPGAYLTGTLHVSSAVWKPSQWAKHPASGGGGGTRALGPPKIQAQDVKVRVMETLVAQYEALRATGAPLLHGEREAVYGRAKEGPPTPSKGGILAGGAGGAGGAKVEEQRAEQMVALLEEGEGEMEAGWKMLSKAGVAVDGWKGKKSSGGGKWGARLSKMTEKMGSQKASMDSPDRYVDLLASLCAGAQVIDEHLTCFTGPCTPAYHLLPEPLYRTLEVRLLRQAEFVSQVVVPFVLDDFRQFFLRYLKGGIKYLED